MAAQPTQLGLGMTVPSSDAFAGQPFKSAPELGTLMNRVIDQHQPRFEVVGDLRIDTLWRARGGTRRGEPVLADCLKPGGLARYYGEADFVLVFAADHLRDLTLTEVQWEALVFEQLCKIGVNENTDSPVLRPYDWQGFTAALEAYGPWREDLREMANTLQPGLFEVEEEADED